jgi:DNA processing protein
MHEPISPELCDLLALHLVPGLGPRLTEALLKHFDSAAAVRQASIAELQEVPHIGSRLSEEFYRALQQVNVDAELELMAKHQVRPLAKGTGDYPGSLAAIANPPPVLYLRGELKPGDANAVAIVGTRQCTSYGRRVAERLAGDLARSGFTVVSGLARGIDGAAHRAALAGGGRTIAVLAGGLSKIYPPEHADLAHDIQAAGALLSEATMAQQPLPDMFPARNRIISGLSRGVVIVEADQKSGALITAHHALDQGREVFSVPGAIDSPASAGCLELIRKGAKLVRGIDDILEELGGVAAPAAPAAEPAGMDEPQRRIWLALAEGSRHLDELAQMLAINVPALSNALMMLEMKKAVRRLPGNRFERW